MKKINIIKGILVCATITLTSLIPSVANAETLTSTTDPGYNSWSKNYKDTSWTGGKVTHYGEFSNGVHCYHRKKNDKSSVYIKNTSNKDAKFKISGESDQYWPYFYAVGYNYNDSEVKCGGEKDGVLYVTIPANSEYSVYNFIKENGFSYAHLDCETSNTKGVWSPDTKGYVTPINNLYRNRAGRILPY